MISAPAKNNRHARNLSLHHCHENGETRRMKIDWNDIPMLLALADSGSMTAAGRALGMDTSTISRRLSAAENTLQTRLFVREGTRYQPTEAGLAFLEHAKVIYGQVQDMLLVTRAQAAGMTGPVRLTALGFLLDHWFIRQLPSLVHDYPGLEWKLIAANQNLSFTRRETDFALRLARPSEDAAVLMTRVGELGFSVYGAKKHMALPRSRWGAEPWLTYGDEHASLPEMQWLGDAFPDAAKRIQTSSVATLRQACEAGLGLALLPCIVGADSGLTRLSEQPELYRELWLLSHKEAGKVERMRAVADSLKRLFDAEAAVLRGKA
jgi:DNA-binding transcriptional LysR family regulator